MAKFVVASVKQIAFDPGNLPPFRFDPGLVRMSPVRLAEVVIRAYGIRSYQLEPLEWFGSEFYDVMAKPPDGATQQEIAGMLQDLLRVRFNFKFHWETRERNGFALVRGKRELKLKQVASDAKSQRTVSSTGRREFRAASLDDFAASLTVCCFKERPLVDQTGLAGRFDIILDVPAAAWSEPREASRAAGDTYRDEVPSLMKAIRGLGLDLTPAKVQVKYLVVDSASRIPTEN